MKRKDSALAISFMFAAAVMLLTAGPARAIKFVSHQSYVEEHNKGAAKFFKKAFALSDAELALLRDKCNIKEPEKTQSFILGRTADGKITGAVFFITIYATEHHCKHDMGIALGPDGSVKDVTITEVECEYAMHCTSRSFLGQFAAKAKAFFAFNEDINGVTGATFSSRAITDLVNFSIAAYKAHVLG